MVGLEKFDEIAIGIFPLDSENLLASSMTLFIIPALLAKAPAALVLEIKYVSGETWSTPELPQPDNVIEANINAKNLKFTFTPFLVLFEPYPCISFNARGFIYTNSISCHHHNL